MDDVITPYAGTSANRLTALINQTNASELVEGVDFVYSELTVSAKPGFNTAIVLHAKKPGKGHSTAYYNRLSLDVLNDLPDDMLLPVVIPSYPTSTHRVLDRINRALGLALTEQEVIDEPYASYQELAVLKINGSTGSRAWLESEYLFYVVEAGNIEQEIHNPVLNGLTPPTGRR